MRRYLCLTVILATFLPQSYAEDKLVFVQAVWRHGDRSPTGTFKNDKNTEDTWPQGWGQLTPVGMQQHVDLGKQLRKRYIDETYKFLNSSYRSHEIYVRSTDVNRTMISAMSNLIAMYPSGANDNGYSYPDIPEWPRNKNGQGFVPIAIHTINDNFDYTLNPDMYCPRQDQLWSLVETTPEYTKKSQEKKDLLDKLSAIAGEPITLTNLWMIADALFIEKAWDHPWIDGITDDMYQDINETNDLVEYWNNGLQLAPLNGINFSIEIPKIRGGSLLWSIIGHMQQKLSCLKNKNQDFCEWIYPLKYYAYSAHDTTIAALFSTLKLTHTNWNEDGYPHYSSCVTVELWQKDDGSDYVKFIYFPLAADNRGHDLIELDIPECNGTCTIASLVARSTPYQPLPDPATLCSTDVFPPTTPPPNSGASSDTVPTGDPASTDAPQPSPSPTPSSGFRASFSFTAILFSFVLCLF